MSNGYFGTVNRENEARRKCCFRKDPLPLAILGAANSSLPLRRFRGLLMLEGNRSYGEGYIKAICSIRAYNMLANLGLRYLPCLNQIMLLPL